MSPMTIESVQARAVLAPLPRPITTAHTAIQKAPLVLIDVKTTDGVIGRCYLFAYTPLVLKPLADLVTDIGATLVGKPVAPADRYRDLEATFRLLGRQGLIAMVMAGIDTALWDALGQAADLSVARMLGSEDRPIPCYDSHGLFVASRDDALIEQSLAMGFPAMKFKVGAGTLAEDVETVLQIRERIGPDIALMVDYNQSVSSAEAVRRIRAMEQACDLDWVEEPVGAEDYAGHKLVRDEVQTAIQTGENWCLPADAARAIAAQISDHVMLDLGKIGGVTGWMRAASLAHAAALPISSHIFVEASAHLMAATPGAHLLEYLDIAGAVLQDPYEVQNGQLAPRGPGLGLAWDEAAVTRYLV